ncbi:MAG: translation initiation factor eIF-1A [Candidatus Aenigmarchaeota archaeon]|nr:translation initiation factor eIF-1A [Candidatus Aenigmarchaeota archaeon]
MDDKNAAPPEIRLKKPGQGETLAIVESMLGTNKLRIMCQDGKARIGRIPGKLRKRVWMREGDVVIIKPWDIQGEKFADIRYRYNPTEASLLRRKGILKISL